MQRQFTFKTDTQRDRLTHDLVTTVTLAGTPVHKVTHDFYTRYSHDELGEMAVTEVAEILGDMIKAHIAKEAD